jgi:hypothetical protein
LRRVVAIAREKDESQRAEAGEKAPFFVRQSRTRAAKYDWRVALPING